MISYTYKRGGDYGKYLIFADDNLIAVANSSWDADLLIRALTQYQFLSIPIGGCLCECCLANCVRAGTP